MKMKILLKEKIHHQQNDNVDHRLGEDTWNTQNQKGLVSGIYKDSS